MTLSPNNPIADLAALLLAAPDSPTRATVIASAVVQVIPDSACIVHRIVFDRPSSPWIAIGKAGDISVRQISQSAPSHLAAAALSPESRGYIYPASDIRREDYAHVNVSRSIASIAYLPLRNKNGIIGVIEIFTFSVELQL